MIHDIYINVKCTSILLPVVEFHKIGSKLVILIGLFAGCNVGSVEGSIVGVVDGDNVGLCDGNNVGAVDGLDVVSGTVGALVGSTDDSIIHGAMLLLQLFPLVVMTEGQQPDPPPVSKWQ